MEHPIGHFITPLCGEANDTPRESHKNGSYSIPKGVYETPLFLQHFYTDKVLEAMTRESIKVIMNMNNNYTII